MDSDFLVAADSRKKITTMNSSGDSFPASKAIGSIVMTGFKTDGWRIPIETEPRMASESGDRAQ
jgi:hypothetical protein